MITIKLITPEESSYDSYYEISSPWMSKTRRLPVSYFHNPCFPEDFALPTRDEIVNLLFELLDRRDETILQLKAEMESAAQQHIKRAFYISSLHDKMKAAGIQ